MPVVLALSTMWVVGWGVLAIAGIVGRDRDAVRMAIFYGVTPFIIFGLTAALAALLVWLVTFWEGVL